MAANMPRMRASRLSSNSGIGRSWVSVAATRIVGSATRDERTEGDGPMLTADGCRQRRQRLWERLQLSESADHLVFGDPAHLRYFANFSVDPISLAADFAGLLLVRRDGHATLFHDNRIPSPAIKNAHVDEFRSVPWYDGQSPGRMPRQLVPFEALAAAVGSPRVHAHPADPA